MGCESRPDPGHRTWGNGYSLRPDAALSSHFPNILLAVSTSTQKQFVPEMQGWSQPPPATPGAGQRRAGQGGSDSGRTDEH